MRATAERLGKLVMSAERGYAAVRRTPCSLVFFLSEIIAQRPSGGSYSEALSAKALRGKVVMSRVLLNLDILFTTPCENKL